MECSSRPNAAPASLVQSSQRPARLILTLILAFALAVALAMTSFPSLYAQAPAEPDAPFATTITVDTSADLDSGSLNKTCTFSSGAIAIPAVDGCTLRRAIIEASLRPSTDRPIAIRFNLAPGDPGANLEVSGTWTLAVDKALLLKTPSIVDRNGRVTIDGATQPGGRTTGPKIIINTKDVSLEVDSENNVIRNLSLKGGGVIFLKRNGNTVDNVWMGLTDNGQQIAFRTPGDPKRMAGGGIFILNTSNNNTITNNHIAGAFARAISIDGGDNNLVQSNFIGLRADGTVPSVPAPARCLRSLSLDPQNWYGGWGIDLSGTGNRILDNRIAGLHILQTANSTPPMAIEIFGSGHEVRGNIIGVDGAGFRAGVCGQGIKVSGSDTEIVENVIVGSRQGFEDDPMTAILASDSSPTFGQITVRGNLVADGPGKIYAFGPLIPQALQAFKPARITKIENLKVTGSAGVGSPCPNCIIDFYTDDEDAIQEALNYLGSANADAQGNFVVTLASPLPPGTGLRLSSTTQSAGVIGSFGAGTTTAISELYTPVSAVPLNSGKLFLPLVKK